MRFLSIEPSSMILIWLIRFMKLNAHSFTRFTSWLLKLSFTLSMHLLPRMIVMLDFIWTLPVHNSYSNSIYDLCAVIYMIWHLCRRSLSLRRSVVQGQGHFGLCCCKRNTSSSPLHAILFYEIIFFSRIIRWSLYPCLKTQIAHWNSNCGLVT